MRTMKWIGLSGLATLALSCASCAPVEMPAPTASSPPSTVEEIAPEPLTLPPRPEPSGPRYRIERAIEHVRRRDLLISNGFWTVFHGILGLGPSVTLYNPDTKERVNAVDYIAGGGKLRGLDFIQTDHGLDVRIGPMMVGQGHQDQFVCEMTQWGMKPDKKFIVHGKEYTFMDFVRHSQARARLTENPPQELGWTIVIVAQHLGLDVAWTNAHGEKLRLEDLLRYELDAPMDTAACGGTHRLFGLSWVYHLHLTKGGEKTGIWKEILDNTIKHRDLAKKYQNPDGSFSTEFFRGPGNAADKQLRINTSGHTLEWLALALPDDQLKQPWVEEAANAVALMILESQDSPIEGGSLYHAVHGLIIYHDRLYGAPGTPELPLPLPPKGALDKGP